MRRSTNSTRTYKRLRIARAGTDEDELRLALSTLDPKAGDTLRRVLIHDQAAGTRSPRSYSATATSEAMTGPTSSTC